MSTATEDPLFQIFEDHLHSGLYDDQPLESFIRDVVGFYWTVLNQRGHVPHHLHEFVLQDLAQDVSDMLRAKIYGHYGIAEYNRRRQRHRT